ncbi:SWIM zinc finger family protein [Jatrophihabitans endophyticus]|uniref:SWIM zinc finger family protein n=1 Tax=Jatrophihabitans endophyticus TaxID=1206085 RepID=UPI001A0A1E81|nr:SWIM zinc finger family protein [Jatrophihabitans endophyticus]MBE7187628.1 SWIM zinc finger family protein [Jatrophihabitans endophyticus]
MTFWRDYPKDGPRAVENGLRARSTRGAIGSTWWSRRFLDVLESLAIGGRLDRGRNYARRGQVISLDVTPGAVQAVVQGSRAKPYEARIGFAPFTELVWAKAEIALAGEALPSAKLLAGEVPPELETIFAAAGAPLFPASARDLVQSCSCPDSEVPCKHLAAVFYLLAEAFDDDPFLLLRWRGRDRAQLLERLRALRSETAADTAEPGPAASATRARSGPAAGAALAVADLAPQPVDPERFWLPPPPLPTRPPVMDVGAGLLLTQLPEPGAELGGSALTRQLARAYEHLAAAADEPDG